MPNSAQRPNLTDYVFICRTLSPMQTDATLLASNTQHCWAQQCCDLLRPFA